MIGMYIQFAHIEAAVDRLADREADGHIMRIGRNKQQTVFFRTLQIGCGRGLASGQIGIADAGKGLLRRALDVAQTFSFVCTAPADSVRQGRYANASSHEPCVEALEYSVARFSKKLACSTPLSIASSQ